MGTDIVTTDAMDFRIWDILNSYPQAAYSIVRISLLWHNRPDLHQSAHSGSSISDGYSQRPMTPPPRDSPPMVFRCIDGAALASILVDSAHRIIRILFHRNTASSPTEQAEERNRDISQVSYGAFFCRVFQRRQKCRRCVSVKSKAFRRRVNEIPSGVLTSAASARFAICFKRRQNSRIYHFGLLLNAMAFPILHNRFIYAAARNAFRTLLANSGNARGFACKWARRRFPALLLVDLLFPRNPIG